MPRIWLVFGLALCLSTMSVTDCVTHGSIPAPLGYAPLPFNAIDAPDGFYFLHDHPDDGLLVMLRVLEVRVGGRVRLSSGQHDSLPGWVNVEEPRASEALPSVVGRDNVGRTCQLELAAPFVYELHRGNQSRSRWLAAPVRQLEGDCDELRFAHDASLRPTLYSASTSSTPSTSALEFASGGPAWQELHAGSLERLEQPTAAPESGEYGPQFESLSMTNVEGDGSLTITRTRNRLCPDNELLSVIGPRGLQTEIRVGDSALPFMALSLGDPNELFFFFGTALYSTSVDRIRYSVVGGWLGWCSGLEYHDPRLQRVRETRQMLREKERLARRTCERERGNTTASRSVYVELAEGELDVTTSLLPKWREAIEVIWTDLSGGIHYAREERDGHSTELCSYAIDDAAAHLDDVDDDGVPELYFRLTPTQTYSQYCARFWGWRALILDGANARFESYYNLAPDIRGPVILHGPPEEARRIARSLLTPGEPLPPNVERLPDDISEGNGAIRNYSADVDNDGQEEVVRFTTQCLDDMCDDSALLLDGEDTTVLVYPGYNMSAVIDGTPILSHLLRLR